MSKYQRKIFALIPRGRIIDGGSFDYIDGYYWFRYVIETPTMFGWRCYAKDNE